MTNASLPPEWLARMSASGPLVGSDARYTDRDFLLPILQRIAAMPGEHLLITIDGPCGSGKTTLAGSLAAILDAPVIHLDDFVIPHSQKTPERLAVPGGNADADRLLTEIIRPWAAGNEAFIRSYLCHEDRFAAAQVLPASRLLILEGTYCNLPPIREHAALRLFLRVDPEEQQRRLLKRAGPERLAAFNSRWIPLENAYFAAYSLPDQGCILL